MDKVGVNKPEDILSDVHKHTQKKILKWQIAQSGIQKSVKQLRRGFW